MPVVRGQRVVCPDGERAAAIHIHNGSIIRIADYDDLGPGTDAADVFDAGRAVVSPGIVDSHVHVNEPGRTEWEGFDTATRAAAAGGVTTIVDMPLNSVPATTTPAALKAKRACARGRAHVDVAFWGGVVPGNACEIDGLVDAGVRGFKCFMAPSGVDEFPAVGEDDLREALPMLARRGVPLLVHAEAPAHLRAPDGPDYDAFLASRPPIAEAAAIRSVAAIAGGCGARVHIVHVASAEAAAEVARARAAGVRMTAETCPHYLTFVAGEIPAGATAFKCAPPIRAASHRAALWSALRDRTLDLIATDHSPAPPSMKCPGDFARAWGGIASLELSLAAVWTANAAHADGGRHPHSIADLAIWMSAAPAALAGLHRRKGAIDAGFDADFVVWNPDAEWTVDGEALQQRHKLTPYAGRRLRGVVKSTFVRGALVWHDGALVTPGRGQLL